MRYLFGEEVIDLVRRMEQSAFNLGGQNALLEVLIHSEQMPAIAAKRHDAKLELNEMEYRLETVIRPYILMDQKLPTPVEPYANAAWQFTRNFSRSAWAIARFRFRQVRKRLRR